MAIDVVLSPWENNAWYIYRYKAATGIFSSNYGGVAAFDYFDNDFAVGDCLYIGDHYYYNNYKCGVKFNIATPIQADAYDLVWEYYHQNTGWQPLTLALDETLKFSVAGVKIARFIPPVRWRHTTINTILTKWIRCRITAATNPTEGGANGTSSVLSRPAVLTVSGSTSAVPATVDNLLGCAEAVEWGLISELGDPYDWVRTVKLSASINLSAVTDYFRGLRLVLNFLPGNFIGAGTYQFGEAYGLNEQGRYGCVISIGHNSTHYVPATLKMWDTTIINRIGQWTGGATLEYHGCQFIFNPEPMYGGQNVIHINTNCDTGPNTYFTSGGYTWTINGGHFDSVNAYQTTAGVMLRNATLRSLILAWKTKMVLFDCSYTVIGGGGVPGEPSYVYNHESLKLTLTNPNGTPLSNATVRLIDKDGNPAQRWTGDLVTGHLENIPDLTPDIDGKISTDVLYYLWRRDNIPGYPTFMTYYGPFRITITSPGYKTKTLKYELANPTTEIQMLEYSQVQIDQENGEIS